MNFLRSIIGSQPVAQPIPVVQEEKKDTMFIIQKSLLKSMIEKQDDSDEMKELNKLLEDTPYILVLCDMSVVTREENMVLEIKDYELFEKTNHFELYSRQGKLKHHNEERTASLYTNVILSLSSELEQNNEFTVMTLNETKVNDSNKFRITTKYKSDVDQTLPESLNDFIDEYKKEILHKYTTIILHSNDDLTTQITSPILEEVDKELIDYARKTPLSISLNELAKESGLSISSETFKDIKAGKNCTTESLIVTNRFVDLQIDEESYNGELLEYLSMLKECIPIKITNDFALIVRKEHKLKMEMNDKLNGQVVEFTVPE